MQSMALSFFLQLALDGVPRYVRKVITDVDLFHKTLATETVEYSNSWQF
jgi:hypothetical protein